MDSHKETQKKKQILEAYFKSYRLSVLRFLCVFVAE